MSNTCDSTRYVMRVVIYVEGVYIQRSIKHLPNRVRFKASDQEVKQMKTPKPSQFDWPSNQPASRL